MPRKNKGVLVAIVVNILAIIGQFTDGGEISYIIPLLIGVPFSFFTSCLGWTIAEKLKKHLKPDVIYYTKTSSLIATKLWRGGGIHILCSSIGTLIPAGIIFSIINAIFGYEIV